MLSVPDYEFWFVTGSQHLYGEEQLKSVAKDAQDIADKLNASGKLPYKVVFKDVMTTAESITDFMKEVNYNDKVAGVITWMHTFSPAKNWIRGTELLQKPLLHLATQYLNNIPYADIDFDYMNLNQSAHGDREYAYINARLNINNKIVYGYWGDEDVQDQIARWEDVAVAYNESFKVKVARFGDTMRNVAVTEGDKVEAQIKMGWTVDYYGIGDLVEEINKVSDADIDKEYADLESKYTMVQGDNDAETYKHSVRVQLQQYLGIKRFLEKGGYTAFTTNFEDLWGMEQLPGLAAQLLIRDGYGFGAEGDWKTAALGRVMKIMSHNDRTAFMEDYTLDLRKGHEAILGSHMLEVDPTIASDKPRVEVHPLDIGGKADPARLVFTGSEGDAIDVTVADFRDGFKMIGYAVDANKPEGETPNLPVAKQLWTPKVGLKTGALEWMKAGGGHHTMLSFSLTEEQMEDFATMVGMTKAFIK
ncbi:L-arabinose isomerase [Levilactobacillus brevis]|uniref:L-arabinose isomerase n=1 Tax=Levilactobacillus brevis TaxID=1580 RepID=UPI00063AB8FD|nr:L-arabinose isomerase [Levilactobacillus brevis]KLE30899.1 arabinose isomerase [Levilactobacillus brevis]MBX6948042.1 L-arabinose isomerase [Levilactobacillus brevis]MCS8596678.1 L-arabinose isomerase [Levilactobacillus brevis]MCT3565119.1 L-arabinose isomerase [Levilactobacillus brevis]MCT3568910.1 L-arabinose isomerase [Levilactobacillus brevis]